jgi:hypothetical protein
MGRPLSHEPSASDEGGFHIEQTDPMHLRRECWKDLALKMRTWECQECHREEKSELKPGACKGCGEHKWKEIE